MAAGAVETIVQLTEHRTMNAPEQLTLAVGCPSCGSEQHHGCGYDPVTVRPVVSVFEALAQTFEANGYTPPSKPTTGILFWRKPS